MRRSLLVICSLVCWLLGLASWSTAASAEEPLSDATVELSASPLVISSSPGEGEQLQAAGTARLANPELVAARSVSQAKYEGLSSQDEANVALAAFPSHLNTLPDAIPSALDGQHVKEYISDHAGIVDLPEGKTGLVEAAAPIATANSGGGYVPLDLRLSDVGGTYQPVAPVAGLSLRIPNRLSDGVSLASAGVSVTPIDGHGVALGGSEGSIVGGSVFYGSTGTDSAVTVQPTTFGFDLQTLIYSVGASEEFFYRMGLPAGASLVQDATGAVQVMSAGSVIAVIEPPYAQDAEGTQVATELVSVQGNVIAVRVAHRSGSYLYPIVLDPEINDKQLVESSGKRSNWEFKTTNGSKFGHEPHVGSESGCPSKVVLETCGIAEYAEGEFAYWGYQTRGNSKIYEFVPTTEGKNVGAQIESFVELEGKSTREEKYPLSSETKTPEYGSTTSSPMCAKNGTKLECVGAAGAEGNVVRFQQSVQKKPSNYKFSDALTAGTVFLSEPAGMHSTTGFNTGSPELEGEVLNAEGKKEKIKRGNVLDGGGWLSKYAGALELLSEDKGVGVSATRLEYESSAGKWEQLSEHKYLETEDLCKGVQCEAKQKEFWVVDPKLPNGEDKIRYRAEDAMPGTESLESEGVATVKVDTAKPHSVFINGLPQGDVLSERSYELTVEATDGEGSTVASSGIKGIEGAKKGLRLLIDGAEHTELGEQTGCSVPKGECTATAKWSINGAELGAGKHQIEVIALDNAGNEKTHYEPISITHSTPVALGPGSVDLQSGDFSLGATDVSMGSGLTVSRNYSSRALEQGAEGPLGPQWNINLGTTESLIELVDHSMMLTDGSGNQTIFAKTESTTYESPTGDSNLKLTVKENEAKTEKLYFLLENAADHTTEKFTLPSGGSKVWVPTHQEGTVATDTLSWSYETVGQHAEYSVPSESSPYAITTGPDGHLWFADHGTNKIGKITSTGYVAEYALPSSSAPCAITSGPEGNLWFTDCGTGKIGKITTTGVITEYNTSFATEPAGITVGPDNNLWFTNRFAGKIGQINPNTGTVTEYADGEGKHPEGITAGPDGNLWFTEKGTNVIGKITTTGTVTTYTDFFHNIRPKEIAVGPDGDLWFTVENSAELLKITTSGTFISENWSAGSGQVGITRGSDGNMWITNSSKNTITKVTSTGAKTEYSEPEGSEPWAITEGPDRNLWYTDLKSNKVAMITTSGTVTRPSEALAPVPAKVECPVGKFQAGCRALKFVYATSTTAKSENESEWGDYAGHLKQVLFEAYNPASKKVEEPGVPVAEYKYDQLGRLRSQWDPRTSSLKTTYGYDEEGHLTALEQPGQEPWLFTYGTAASDLGSGRLLSLTRTSASTSLSLKPKPVNSEAPKLSTTSPSQGIELSSTSGVWSNGPVTYGYQWERCASNGVCSVIIGATNHTYVPTAADVEDKLLVQVSATNNGGTTSTLSAMSGKVLQLPAYSSQFGGAGSGEGQMKSPSGVAMDSSGNIWVLDSANHRVQEFSSAGSYLTQFGSEGAGQGQFKEPVGIAIDSKNNIWVSDQANNNIQEFNEKHEWIRTISSWKEGSPPLEQTITLKNPRGLAIDSKGDVWFAESSNSVVELTETGEHIKNISEWIVELFKKESLTTPGGVAIDPHGNIWIADTGNNRVVEFSATGNEFVRQFGTAGTGNGQFKEPKGITAMTNGQIWVADTLNNRMQKFTASGEYLGAVGSVGTGNGQLKEPRSSTLDSNGDMWVADTANNRVQKFAVPTNTTPPAPPNVGSNSVTTLDYGVPLQGASAPAQMGVNAETHKHEPEKWGQNEENDPVEATSIFPPDSPQGWPASSYTRATTYYFDEHGRAVNVANPSKSSYGAISTTEYNEENDATRTLSPDNRITAMEAGTKSVEVATTLSTFNTYKNKCSRESEFNEERESVEFGTRLCETEGPMHTVKYTEGKEQKEGLARNHLRYFYDEKVPAGEPYTKETYNLVTETKNLTEITNSKGGVEKEIEPRTTITSYSGQGNLGWKLRAPTSVTTDAQLEGQKLTHTTLYNEETGQITETRAPKGAGGNSAHDSKIVYYSSEENKEGYTSCGKHPEWQGLVCETLPAKQPETSKVPNLPVIETTAYNMWNEPETTTETFTFTPHPTTTRTKKNTYDTAGRLTSSKTTATGSEDKTLPEVTYEYESKLGVLEKENATVEGKLQTISSKYDTLGEITEYTDANGNTTKYKYYGSENDGSIQEVSDSSNEGKSKQTYSYDATTKLMTKLTDSAAETFTATYDAEGKMSSEVYPNGMCANYTYNSVGEATGLEYIKTTNCSESKPTVWFSESKSSTVRGETLSRTSTLANETYTYDTLGRLTETQEAPAGEGCSVRLYAYDEESNRTSSTTRKPGSKNECLTTGGTEEKHAYDEANRMTDTGIEYESLGNITKLPAADAEGHELTSTFYVDGAVATQSQHEITNEYKLDPNGRIQDTISGGKETINHYDGVGGAVAWTCELIAGKCEAASKWTRNIPGIDGTLAAVQTNGGTPILQLHDLQGNIVATAELSSAATKLLSTYNSTEYGVPNSEKTPPPFAWLGASDVSKALSSGVITYGATSYVPQTGLALQTEQVDTPGYPVAVGGGTPATFTEEAWVFQGAGREATEAPGIGAAEQLEATDAATNAIDPGKCVAIGQLNEIEEWNHRRTEPYANFTCKGKADDVKIELCIVEQGKFAIGKPHWGGSGECEVRKFKVLPSSVLFWLDRFECRPGILYALWAWYWEPGMKIGDEGWGKYEECKADDEEIYFQGVREGLESTVG